MGSMVVSGKKKNINRGTYSWGFGTCSGYCKGGGWLKGRVKTFHYSFSGKLKRPPINVLNQGAMQLSIKSFLTASNLVSNMPMWRMWPLPTTRLDVSNSGYSIPAESISHTQTSTKDTFSQNYVLLKRIFAIFCEAIVKQYFNFLWFDQNSTLLQLFTCSDWVGYNGVIFDTLLGQSRLLKVNGGKILKASNRP